MPKSIEYMQTYRRRKKEGTFKDERFKFNKPQKEEKTAGYRNSELSKNNPYMDMSIAGIKTIKQEIEREIKAAKTRVDVANRVIDTSKMSKLVTAQKSVRTRAQKRIEKLDKQWAQAEYAEKMAKNRKEDLPF